MDRQIDRCYINQSFQSYQCNKTYTGTGADVVIWKDLSGTGSWTVEEKAHHRLEDQGRWQCWTRSLWTRWNNELLLLWDGMPGPRTMLTNWLKTLAAESWKLRFRTQHPCHKLGNQHMPFSPAMRRSGTGLLEITGFQPNQGNVNPRFIERPCVKGIGEDL